MYYIELFLLILFIIIFALKRTSSECFLSLRQLGPLNFPFRQFRDLNISIIFFREEEFLCLFLAYKFPTKSNLRDLHLVFYIVVVYAAFLMLFLLLLLLFLLSNLYPLD